MAGAAHGALLWLLLGALLWLSWGVSVTHALPASAADGLDQKPKGKKILAPQDDPIANAAATAAATAKAAAEVAAATKAAAPGCQPTTMKTPVSP